MTANEIIEHLPQCEKESDCDRPASTTVYDLGHARWIRCCRPHKREVNRANAKYVGECQFLHDYRAARCKNFPVTMRMVDGEDMAVCAMHDAHLNQQYATIRKHAS